MIYFGTHVIKLGNGKLLRHVCAKIGKAQKKFAKVTKKRRKKLSSILKPEKFFSLLKRNISLLDATQLSFRLKCFPLSSNLFGLVLTTKVSNWQVN